LKRFTREILYSPEQDILFVFDRVSSWNSAFRKAWLLHGVNQPTVDKDSGDGRAEAKEFKNANTIRFREGTGELLLHSLLPRERIVIRRGGPGQEFYTPGDDRGGAWGSGQNWPLEPAEGGPLPQDPNLAHMWKQFWGDDFEKISPSNRKNVVPGAWRIEVYPALAAEEDYFLHLLEIGNTRTTRGKRVALIEAVNFNGAVFEGGPCVLFATSDSARQGGEVSIPEVPVRSLIVTSLQPNTVYELSFHGPNVASSPSAALPGVRIDMHRGRANEKGILFLDGPLRENARVLIRQT
jgi:heparin/heparan-sulfate lyase